MGILDSFSNIDDLLVEYGPSAGIGAGLGFLMGGPPGAALGAATAIGSQYAAPRIAKEIGGPEWFQTGVEYGIYGASAGPAIGQVLARQAGARVAQQIAASMSRSALVEGAKVGVGSGVGAVVGQQGARAAGAPDWLGEIGGSLVGPFAPGIGRRLRADFMENVVHRDQPMRFQGLAQASAEGRASTAGNARTPPQAIDGERILGSSADAAKRARAQATMQRRRAEALKTKLDDDEIRALTGVTSENPRRYLDARAKGQMPDELIGDAGPMTPELRKAQRALRRATSTLTNADERLTTAEEQLRASRQLIADGAEGDLVMATGGPNAPEGEAISWVYRTTDGVDIPVSDNVAQKFLDSSQAYDRAVVMRERHQKSLKELTGVDELPEDLSELDDVLRRKILGDDLADFEVNLMSREDAMVARRLVLSKEAEFNADAIKRKMALDDNAARYEELADFLEGNPKYGAPTQGSMAQASRDLQSVRLSEDLQLAAIKSGHRFIDVPTEQGMSFDDYLKVADYIVEAQPTPARAAEVAKDLAENPRGTAWIRGPEGTAEKRNLIGVDPVNRVAFITENFESRANPTAVALDDLIMRFDPEQHAALMSEITTAQKVSGKRPRSLPRPQILATRRHWVSQRDYDQAVDRAIRQGSPVPQADAILEDDIALAWQQFESNFMPAGNTFETKGFTPESTQKEVEGIRNALSLRPRHSATKQEREAFIEFQRKMRGTLKAIEDEHLAPGAKEMLEEMGFLAPGESIDPRKPFFNLLQQSDTDVVHAVRQERTGFGGMLGQFLDRAGITGIRIRTGPGRAMLQNFIGTNETTALWVQGTYGASRVSLARSLLNKFDTPGANRFSGTISDDGKLHTLLLDNFQPELMGGEIGEAYALLDEAQQAVAKPWLASQLRTLLEHPEAFPKLANMPEVQATQQTWRMLDTAVNEQMVLLGVTPQSHSRRFSMLVDRRYRPYLNPDVLNPKGLERRPPHLLDVFDSVWQGARGYENGGANRVRQALVHGAAADNSWALAGYQSMSAKRLEQKIRALATEEVGPDDIIMREGQWSIKNLNKWPEEYHDELRSIMEIGGGQHKWSGLQQLSQRIALGNLALDLSIVGVQGFKVAAHNVLAGRPFRAARIIADGLTHVTTDYGYYSFLRQNMDEIMYYTNLGLTGGIRGQIAGPELTKAPLEDLPMVNKIATGLYGLSDIQYGRALFYWKVQGIRENLEAIRNLRAFRGQVSEKFLADIIESSPTLREAVRETGGLEAFFLANDEQTVQSVVRQVSRSLSSVNLEAEGVGPYRRAFEQITTIVPGFFRGQVGQWAAAVSKPTSVEGQLAISMLAREYMFGAMISTGFARMFGTEERINWDDMSKASWLGVPLPDELGGGTMTLLPTMGIPRLAARQVREATRALEGEGYSPDQALESFAHGRLSPLAGAIYDNISGKDFLGRRYDSQLEKWGHTLSSVTLPIIMQSAIEDATEEIKHAQATGSFNYKDMALSSAMEILGKGVIPTHPSEQLDKVAVSAYDTEWQFLTDAEKDELRRVNPAVAAAEAEYDFWSSRRAGSKETYIDMAYKDYEANVENIWMEPIMIDGIATAQIDDDALLRAGQLTGDTWRQRYHQRQQATASAYDALLERLDAEGVSPEKVREERLARLVENRPEDRAVLLQLGRAEYLAVSPPTEVRTISTPEGEIQQEVVDWDGFFTAREDVLQQYPEELRNAIRRSSRADEFAGIQAYQNASVAQREIESLGRYRGLTAQQGDKIDSMLNIVDRVGESIRAQVGAASGSIPRNVIEQAAIQQMRGAGIISTEDDLRLLTIAFAMSRDSKLKDAFRNPAQMAAILNSPEVVLYYPYLRWRLPQQFWTELPQEVFSAPVFEAQLAASF